MVQLGKKGRAVPPLTQEEIDLIDDRLGRGEALPPELSEKVVAIVRRPAGKRGPDPGALVSRDVMIRWTIANLVRHCGLNPTRKRSTTKTESAASIVTKVLNELGEKSLTEGRVNRIWEEDPYKGWYYRPPSA
jgi:hypothetical protein